MNGEKSGGETRRLSDEQLGGRQTLFDEGVKAFIAFSAEHPNELDMDKDIAARAKLAEYLENLPDSAFDTLSAEDFFDQAISSLGAIGITEDDHRFKALFTSIIIELSKIEATIDDKFRNLADEIAIKRRKF